MSLPLSINDLPPHTIIDILSRLPIKTIVQCKCVCNVWRNLLEEPYFVNLHLSRSPTSLITHQMSDRLPPSDSDILKLVEFEDDHDRHGLQYDPSTKFDLRFCYPKGTIHLVGSVNGLLCFCDYQNEALFVCNPAVRQNVSLVEPKHKTRYPHSLHYGFGFSPVSGQYKVVQIFQRALLDPAIGPCSYECQGEVYTLGTGKWRSIGTVPFLYDYYVYSVFLNGNIHWLICEEKSPESICSFDVEKELFQAFPAPPGLSRGTLYKSLGLLGGCLCVCDNSSDSDLVVWTMKEYGIKESWTKELVIRKNSNLERLSYAIVTPMKVWKNGDVLMLWRDDVLFSYSPERKTLEEVHVPRDSAHVVTPFITYEMLPHMASLLSLKDFGTEKVDTF
ncbi:F-box protein At3g07870-like [Actinidia eriantha]|uniref:F-box protein At3g07870-like n=1 Tax=Actinidia eriantha TaxID=165200 RepID=UPI00258C34D1|nr:F-box protein At3g07870-like [Actinidia eriantha]